VKYTEFSFHIEPAFPWYDILTQELGDLGFDCFTEDEGRLRAYIPSGKLTKQLPARIEQMKRPDMAVFDWEIKDWGEQNWNAEWERDYPAVEIADLVRIRAPFHTPSEGFRLEVVVHPRMAFGTGHHSTTRLMSTALFNLQLSGKALLDMGCGTGVLAIIAEKLGAGEILAVDIEPQSAEASINNALLNNCEKIKVLEGSAEHLKGRIFDVVLANINRNILLNHLPEYDAALSKGGDLLLSGFFSTDADMLAGALTERGFRIRKIFDHEGWAMIHAVK
jgi:ribosomal protein L11 methyltransferase